LTGFDAKRPVANLADYVEGRLKAELREVEDFAWRRLDRDFEG
jgi:hypothetical protein